MAMTSEPSVSSFGFVRGDDPACHRHGDERVAVDGGVRRDLEVLDILDCITQQALEGHRLRAKGLDRNQPEATDRRVASCQLQSRGSPAFRSCMVGLMLSMMQPGFFHFEDTLR